MRGFADVFGETESVLETCILRSKMDDYSNERCFRVFQYLIDQGAAAYSGSSLAAFIYMNGPDRLVE